MTHDNTGSFQLHRKLPLSAEQLWKILTNPDHRMNWGAPELGMKLTVERSDLSVGGQDRMYAGSADAPDFIADTRWYHLAAPSLAAFTETISAGGDCLFTSLVTYTLIAGEGSTDLHVTVALSSFCGPDALKEVKDGWNNGLGNLQTYISAL